MTFSVPMPPYSSIKRSSKPSRVRKKPPKQKPLREAFKVMDDGREICYTIGTAHQSVKGRKEYRRRLGLMLERQKGICCLFGHIKDCPGPLALEEATFEHENGRSSGRRDDRIEIEGKWLNGAAHLLCNQAKGSRKIRYNIEVRS